MKKLLSLPPNLVECFHDITHADRNEWFCTSDPIGHKLGSGGGTTWLLRRRNHLAAAGLYGPRRGNRCFGMAVP